MYLNRRKKYTNNVVFCLLSMNNHLKSKFMRLTALKIPLLYTLLVLTFFGSIAAISYKQSTSIKNTIFWIKHTQDVLYNSEKILTLLSNYEQEAIDFGITDTKTSTNELLSLKNEINSKLQLVKKLTIDNNVQQQNVKLLTAAINKKVLTSDSIFNLKNTNALNKTLTQILNIDRLNMLKIKQIVVAIQGEEDRLLQIRIANNEEAFSTMKYVLFALGCIIFLLLGAIVRRVQQSVFEKQKMALLHEHSALIDLSNEAIISTDEHFNILQWSMGAEKIYGYTKNEVLGKGIIQYVASKVDAAVRIDMINDLQKNGRWQGELVQFDKYGNERHVLISYSRILNPDGSVKGYTSTRTDISARKNLEKKLKDLNASLELDVNTKTAEIKEVFERMAKAFLAFDSNWKCTYLNEPVLEYLKANKEEVIGKKLGNLIEGITATQFYKACLKAMETQQVQELQEFIPFFNAWFESSIYPSPQGVSIYISDITKEKTVEKELMAKKSQLRSLTNHIQNLREEERKIIARELHDDLGQVATVLKIDIKSIKNGLLNGSTDVETKINNTLVTIDELIKKIRKISHGLRPDLLDTMGLQAALKSHCLEFEKKTNISCFFYNETNNERLPQDFETALFRICQESLTNILRHAEATEVIVTFSKNNDELQLQISDNGNGFDVAKDGNTLGLIGIKERAVSIKFNLTIASELGNGTTITVSGILLEHCTVSERMYI